MKEAVKMAGGPAQVARTFNIRSQAVSQWERCPSERARKLAELAGLHPCQLRPDLYDPPNEAA